MASEVPKATKISINNHRRLMSIQERMAAVQQAVQMFQGTCEQRLAQLQTEGRQVWLDIKQEAGIDLDGIMWEPHPSEPLVVPTQMKIKQG